MEYIRSAHSVYLLTYHIVFVTKYRKPVISDEISEFLKNHIGYLCTRFDAELLTAETDKDHIHMLISMPPKVAPRQGPHPYADIHAAEGRAGRPDPRT